jgi:hypothetical protein
VRFWLDGSFIENSYEPSTLSEEVDKRFLLVQEYVGVLLNSMQDNLDSDRNRTIIKQLSRVHYKELNIDELLKL